MGGRLSFRWRVIFIVFAVITLPIELVVHGAFAREYYYLNVKYLRLVALTAVKIGAEYLPADPPAAIRVADAYAQHHGIALTEIVLTELSSDGNVLTIRLERKIPQYVAVLTMGGLPARDITVMASAWQQRAGHPFGTQVLEAPVSKSGGHEGQNARVFSAAFENLNAPLMVRQQRKNRGKQVAGLLGLLLRGSRFRHGPLKAAPLVFGKGIPKKFGLAIEVHDPDDADAVGG